MSKPEYDCLVIGAGSGGVRCARMAAQSGARVGVIEQAALGGTCVNQGCVPKKLLVYAGLYGQALAEAAGYGWEVSPPRHHWQGLIAAKDREIARLNGAYQTLLEEAGVEILRGRAVMEAPHTVMLGEGRLRAKTIVFATGGEPFRLDIPGAELACVSDDMFTLERLPRSALVIGGGYIALEFACILHALGVATTLSYHRTLPLRGADVQCRQHLLETLKAKGVSVLHDHKVTALERHHEGVRAKTNQGDLTPELVLMATGRRPLTAGLGLERAGIARGKKGEICVNEAFQTNVAGHYAIGDVTGGMQLTPVAIRHGARLAHDLYGSQAHPLKRTSVPTAIFTQPCYAYAGLNEEQARESHDIVVYSSTFKPMRGALSGSNERVFMKMITEAGSERVLGVHMIGEEAAEIVQALAVALSAGATKADFDATLAVHPSTAEEFVTLRTGVERGRVAG